MSIRTIVRRLPLVRHARKWPGRLIPTISVIVPVYNVESYLRECLDSILQQSFRRFEVVAVDDGSTDGSPDILREFARKDPRLRVIQRSNGGLGAARNIGVEHARGSLLTFVDSDDVLPPGALERLAIASRSSGADIVMGAVSRFRDDEPDGVPLWVRDLHSRPRLTTVASDPSILRNFYTWNKVYRADFWRREKLQFRERVLFEDQPLVTRALCAASAVFVLDELTYRWRIRSDGSSLTGGMYSSPAIKSRHQAVNFTREALNEMAVPAAIMDGWLWTLAEHHLPNYLAATAPLNTAHEYAAVCEMVREHLDTDTVLRLPDVSASSRVLLYLALTETQESVATFLAEGGRQPKSAQLRPDGDSLRVALPFYPGDEQPRVPLDAYTVSPREQRLWTVIHDVSWTDRRRVLRIRGAGGITLAPAGSMSIEIHATESGGQSVDILECPVVERQVVDDAGGRPALEFTAEVNLSALASTLANRHASRAHLTVRLTQGGVERIGPLRGAASHAYARKLAGTVIDDPGGLVVGLTWTVLQGLIFVLDRPAVVTHGIGDRDNAQSLEVRILTRGILPRRVVTKSVGRTGTSALRRVAQGVYVAVVDLSAIETDSVSSVHVLDVTGRRHPVYGEPDLPAGYSGSMYLRTTASGQLRVVRNPDAATPGVAAR